MRCTIICKMFWEKLRNQAKLDKNEKFWYLFWRIFRGPVPKIYFCGGDWALCCVLMEFWDFANVSLLPTTLSVKSYGELFGNSYIRFLILDITFQFTCDKWSFVKFQVIMQRIVIKYLISCASKLQFYKTKKQNLDWNISDAGTNTHLLKPTPFTTFRQYAENVLIR